MKLKFFLPFIFLFFYLLGYSQSGGGGLILPYEVGDKRKGIGNQEQISFISYPYDGAKIDLRDYKKRTPQLKIPDFITIIPPDLVSYDNMTVLIGWIKANGKNEESLIIWLADNYYTNEVTFYLDKRLTRNFLKDAELKRINSFDKPVKVIIKSNNNSKELWLSVPKKVARSIKLNKSKSEIINQFSVGFLAGVGFGQLTYVYDNLDKGFPTWYSVNYTEKNLGLSISYNTSHLRFSLNGLYQNVFYYTSYLNVQFDEPERRFSPSIGKFIIIDNVQVDNNLDRHPTHHFQYSATIAARLFLLKGVEVQPLITVGQTVYSPGIYEGDRYEKSQQFRLLPNTFFETGMRFEFISGQQKSIFIDVIYNRSQWKPKGFFESVPFENLEVENSTWKITFGYRFGF